MPMIISMNTFQTAIVVLNYNGLEVSKKFLNHLYSHTKDFLLILIDNGSNDSSVEYFGDFASKNSNVIFISNDTNLGVIGGRNQGYEIYSKLENNPKFICFLDNDQFVNAGWLEHHYEVLSQSNADLVGVEAWLMNSNLRPVKQCKHINDPWTYVGCGGMLMKSIVPETIGMFDPQFNPCYFEDPDFCFRASDAGFIIAWNSKAKLVHMPHQTLGKNSKRMIHFENSHLKLVQKWRSKRRRPTRQHLVDSLM